MRVKELEYIITDEIIAIKGYDTTKNGSFDFYNDEIFEFFSDEEIYEIVTIKGTMTITLSNMSDNEVHKFFNISEDRVNTEEW